MKTIISLCLLFWSLGVQAQVPLTTVVGNGALTNSLIVLPTTTNHTTSPVKLYAVMVNNTSNVLQYVQLHQSTTNMTNGAIPLMFYPVPAATNGSTGWIYWDFNQYGVNLDAATVMMSTTSNTLTLGSASSTIQAIIKNP